MKGPTLARVLFVRCDRGMHARLVALAHRRKVTLAQLVRYLLDKGLRAAEASAEAIP